MFGLERLVVSDGDSQEKVNLYVSWLSYAIIVFLVIFLIWNITLSAAESFSGGGNVEYGAYDHGAGTTSGKTSRDDRFAPTPYPLPATCGNFDYGNEDQQTALVRMISPEGVPTVNQRMGRENLTQFAYAPAIRRDNFSGTTFAAMKRRENLAVQDTSLAAVNPADMVFRETRDATGQSRSMLTTNDTDGDRRMVAYGAV